MENATKNDMNIKIIYSTIILATKATVFTHLNINCFNLLSLGRLRVCTPVHMIYTKTCFVCSI